jgi:hypothetical protein
MAGPKPNPGVTDRERHQRFVEMACEVEASEEAEAFNTAFNRVAHPSDRKPEGADGG